MAKNVRLFLLLARKKIFKLFLSFLTISITKIIETVIKKMITIEYAESFILTEYNITEFK